MRAVGMVRAAGQVDAAAGGERASARRERSIIAGDHGKPMRFSRSAAYLRIGKRWPGGSGSTKWSV